MHTAFCTAALFRLGDVYLMYAEAVIRGSTTTALSHINALRTRAFGNASGNVACIGFDA